MIGKKVSHYRVIERLGGGGMGVVYKAEDLKLERLVALKFLPHEFCQEEKRRKRFVQEAKAASSLDHPNLCTIYEIDQTRDGQMFISMALYEGKTLKEKISSGSLTIPDALDIACQMADGLAIAHEHGIWHRDIKPANVIVTRSGLVKILDFGLAKLTGASQITEAETAVGTISYMSPEQALGKTVDQRADIWSWGLVLHEMVTGKHPFPAENPLQILHSLISSDPVPLSETSFSPEIGRILQKALAKELDDRYSSIAEANHDLRSVRISGQSLTVTALSLKGIAEATVPEFELPVTPQRAEKKPLTFVTAGIAGYAELLEQLQLDDVQRFLNNLQKFTESLAEKYRAVLNEFDPDRIVVLFGIPASQENDFLTAVHFAFDLQNAVSEISKEFCGSCEQLVSLRAGIHSGLVVMQPSLRGRSKYEITGVPFQIALTLASNAKPNEVVITQESRRLMRQLFLTESRDAILVPGMSKSTIAYAILNEAHSLTEVFLAPYTGRQKEMTLLQDCWQKATEGRGQFVTLIGEAGVGKSRLFSEFKRNVQGSIRYLHGRGDPYATAVPYAPFCELVVNALELPENHPSFSADEVIKKIQEIDPRLEDFIPLYLHLLSIQSDRYPFPKHLEGENLRLAILDALSVFVLVKKHTTVLLLLEDWHCADEASQNAFKQILEMLPEQSILAVACYRPDSSQTWSGVRNLTQIYLEPLESSSSRELMSSLLDAERVSDSLAQLVYDRSGGNPFFVEEICLNLKEEGKVKVEKGTAILSSAPEILRLPETIQALILSRLDRLNRKTKEILQTASVIGREFTRTILQRVAGNEPGLASILTTLKTLGLIQQVNVLPEPAYKFRHALTQEVAYDSLLAHEKKQIHQLVAEAIEDFYKERLEEHLDFLAEHFSRADHWSKAVEYGAKSSEKVRALGQFSEALNILKKAETWLLKLPDNPSRNALKIDLMLREERLCETLGIRDRQEQILQELLNALKNENDQQRQMEVYRRQGELMTLLARFNAAEAALQESLSLSESLNDRSGERNAWRSIGFMRWHQGKNEEAVASNQKALLIDRERGDKEALATDLTNMGSVLRNHGDLQAALACLEEALKLYEQINDPVKHAAALHMLGNVHRELGNPEEAMNCIQAAMAVSTRYRLVIMQSFHLTSLANMCWQEGKLEECLDLQKRAVERNRKSHYADGLATSLRMVGETLQGMARQAEALPYLEEAASLFSKLQDFRNEAALLNKIAILYEEQELWDETLNVQQKLKTVHESMGNKKGIVETAEWMAKVCRKKGDSASAIQNYREAIQALDVAEDPAVIAALLNSIAILEWKGADYEPALNDYQKALEIFRDLGDEVHSGLIMNSIGLTLKSMRRAQEALTILQEAVVVNRRTGQRKLEGHSLAAIADLQSDGGQIDLAMQHYQEALQIKRETGDAKGEAWMLYHLARLQLLGSVEARSEDYMVEAEKMVADFGDQKLKDAWKELQRAVNHTQGGNRA
ncbi:tetratricopeptide repeat protein [bacterium]|nr:tetratricopeptide repeat protein [bacterium]